MMDLGLRDVMWMIRRVVYSYSVILMKFKWFEVVYGFVIYHSACTI